MKESAEKHQSAAALLPMYGDHCSGMAQVLVWTALEMEGLGANLQHVGCFPAVEPKVKEFCEVPEDYKLKAHINYGDKAQEHPEKPEKLPFSETVKVISG